MTEKIIALAEALGQREADERLRTLCAASEQTLTAQLRPGLTASDCGEAFPLAAAWLSLAALDAGENDGVTAFTAGDVSVRQEGGRRSDELRTLAANLMRPWLADEGFAFLGVPG